MLRDRLAFIFFLSVDETLLPFKFLDFELLLMDIQVNLLEGKGDLDLPTLHEFKFFSFQLNFLELLLANVVIDFMDFVLLLDNLLSLCLLLSEYVSLMQFKAERRAEELLLR